MNCTKCNKELYCPDCGEYVTCPECDRIMDERLERLRRMDK